MRYTVRYISSNDHDTCSVWTEADSKEEARKNVQHEYWDVEEIISVIEN